MTGDRTAADPTMLEVSGQGCISDAPIMFG